MADIDEFSSIHTISQSLVDSNNVGVQYKLTPHGNISVPDPSLLGYQPR